MISSTEILYPSGMTQACKFPRAGMVLVWPGNNPPVGSFWCDGAYVNKTVYPNLHGVIGDRYNDANTPANNFKLPDFRNKFLFGAGSTNTAVSAINHGNWQIQEFKHQHVVNVSALQSFSTSGNVMEPGSDNTGIGFQQRTSDALTINVNTTAAKQDFIPPYTIINYIIYHD